VVLADSRVLNIGGKTAKNVTGCNLIQLFVGSEGTLGVITELILKLLSMPKVACTARVAFPRLADACRCVSAILSAGITPAAIELMDETAIATIEQAMHLNLPLNAEAILMIKADGMHGAAVTQEIEAIADICRATGACDVHVAPNKLGEDISVPRSAIADAVAGIKEISRRIGIPIAIFGHAGDGNLHPVILFDRRDPQQKDQVKQAAAEIFEVALRLGGTLSGEHGVGSLKLPFLEKDVGPVFVEAMASIKKALDPKNILNPGKVVPGTAPGAMEFLAW
jgi:glycolate oxidase